MHPSNVYMTICSALLRNITVGIPKVEFRGLLQNFDWPVRAKIFRSLHFGCHIWNQHIEMHQHANATGIISKKIEKGATLLRIIQPCFDWLVFDDHRECRISLPAHVLRNRAWWFCTGDGNTTRSQGRPSFRFYPWVWNLYLFHRPLPLRKQTIHYCVRSKSAEKCMRGMASHGVPHLASAASTYRDPLRPRHRPRECE